uniref:NADH-ubiquinone oxidoreductase chain 2 n=1 Tax=Lachesilla sp. LaspMLY TaxID=2597020 RepID=A0A8K1ZG01_9NEOP|nr:NADH dehydrogenase subunit 2 [Lachesilla sp. LaspMLY]
MMNNLNILFLLLTFSSSLLSISSTSWFSAWMGLELNMLSFVPLLIEQKNLFSNEAGLKYFLIQALASSLFLMFSILNTFFLFSFFIFMNFKFNPLSLPLLMKLGAPPFQTWFIMIMNKLTWYKGLLLSTWQKFAPLLILSYLELNINLITFMALLSMMIGSVGGLNQMILQKILAFSSISHLGWLFSSMLLNKNLLFIYFLIYSMISWLLFMFFSYNNIFHFNQNLSPIQLLIFSISMLSLGGLPPLLGFLPKWLIIQNLIILKYSLLTTLLIFLTLLTLFFYIRLILNFSLILSQTTKWMSFNNFFYQNKFYFILSSLNFSMLMLFNVIFS